MVFIYIYIYKYIYIYIYNFLNFQEHLFGRTSANIEVTSAKIYLSSEMFGNYLPSEKLFTLLFTKQAEKVRISQ